MALARSAFAETFRRLVVPRLRDLIDTQAQAVAAGLVTFSEGVAMVMREALRLGYSYLPAPHRDLFEDWVTTTLCEAVDRAEGDAGPYPGLAPDDVTADVERWDRAVREWANGQR